MREKISSVSQAKYLISGIFLVVSEELGNVCGGIYEAEY